MADIGAATAADDSYAMALMTLHGVPAEIVAGVPAVSGASALWSESVAVEQVLRDGDVLRAGGRDLHVRLRPGHSPADTLFTGADGVSLVGDHVLARHPSVTLAEPPPRGPADPRQRPRMILAYRESLAATAAEDLVWALPGHGPTIDDPAAIAPSAWPSRSRAPTACSPR